MDPEFDWNAFFAARGGTLAAGAVHDFGAPDEELAASRDAAALVPLTHLGALTVAGSDAGAFLQSQLTSDVSQVSAGAAQLSGYCTPKGRLLATFLVVLQSKAYRLVMPRALAPSVAARLRKYVLRSKVTITDSAAELALLGVCGPRAQAALSRALPSPPGLPPAAAHYPSATVVALPGECFLVLVDAGRAEELWGRLSTLARPAGLGAWDWRQIRAGMASVVPATQEAFLPQMLDLEVHGAVSYQKGCYPGQEIVARTHYLGDLKRRLMRASARAAAQPGDNLLAGGSQVAGTVAMAAPSPDGGWEMLAVVQRDQLTGRLTLADGTPVELTPVRPADAAQARP
jgi:folate-binding protein YgfZ